MKKKCTRTAILLGNLFSFLLVLLTSCTHEPVGIEEFEIVCFETEIMPILQTSCGMTGCHGNGSAEEGFDVSNYETVMKAVTPGDPRRSDLYKVLTDINGEKMMPPDRPLSREQRTLIQLWIYQGANESVCNDSSGICFVQDILPMMLSGCGTTGCHDAATHEEGYVLTDYNTIMQKGIVPFKPNNSKIIEVLTETGEDRMPPSPRSPFTAEQIAAMRTWVADGALNSDCPGTVCDTVNAIRYSSQVEPLLQANCLGCHNSSLASGGVILSSYTNVLTYVQSRNGTPVITGTIKKLAGFQPMPPTFSLDECSIRIMELWITQGAANN